MTSRFYGVAGLYELDVQGVNNPEDPQLDDFRDLNSIDRRSDLPTGRGLVGLVIVECVLVVRRMLASPFRLGIDRRLVERKDDLADASDIQVPYYTSVRRCQ
ncbi:hypothetical protein A8144_06545 [Mycobacterium leprae 3125609]|nr:hypothetical protein [Mycobacterium leprae]OAR21353.1 hypothetical protein A8144_06545 [Mycobacterium leprae 3125609]OAX71511.1 hypothetical protein A3216_05325 [Mycobacterium leprae 7935681]